MKLESYERLVKVTIELEMIESAKLHTAVRQLCEEHKLGPMTEDMLHRAVETGPICDVIMQGKANIVIHH